MQVFEYRCHVKLKEDIPLERCVQVIGGYINSGLALDAKMLEFHEDKAYKMYVFDSFYPIEKDMIYTKDKIYTFRIRSVKKELISYFSGSLSFHETRYLKGCGGELKLIPKKEIRELYSITPVLIKNDFGYWKNNMTIEEYENRLVDNLIKKYKALTNKDLDENLIFYNLIEFKNKAPVKVPYKNTILLGDKLHLYISPDPLAQELAYLALGVGLGENNAACGTGFLNFK